MARTSCERSRASSGKNLYCDISQRRGLGRTGQNSSSGGVRGQLVQQAILRSAADDANLLDALPAHLLQIPKNQTVLEREALQNGSHVRAGFLRHRLMSSACRTGRWPRACRSGARRIRHRDRRGDGTTPPGRPVPSIRDSRKNCALRGPGLPAALQHPEAHDVLQQPRRSVHAAFVGEVQAQRIGRDDRGIQFGAQQRPGSGTEKGSAVASRDCGHGRARVVTRGSDYGRARKRGMTCDVRQECTKDRARLDDRCRQVEPEVPGAASSPVAHVAFHWVHHLGGGCVGEFADCISGQPVIEIDLGS